MRGLNDVANLAADAHPRKAEMAKNPLFVGLNLY
jgi:hypothetical protein